MTESAHVVQYQPEDELPHVEDHPLFNDSVYFNFYDPVATVGGVIRVGNRVNLGYAETTVSLPLPDGSLFFYYDRAALGDPMSFDSGGLRVEVPVPFHELTISFAGIGAVVKEPSDLATRTKSVLREAEQVRCELELTWNDRYPLHVITGSGDMLEGSDQPFARDHYEQFGFLTGHVKVGETTYQLTEAPGSRDHSWGPRDWLAPSWWNASLVYLPDGRCMSASAVRTHDDELVVGGTIFTPDGRVRSIAQLVFEDTYAGEPGMDSVYTIRATAVDGYEFVVEGNNINFVPLRHRPQKGGVTTGVQRIGQAMSTFTAEDGVSGWGWTDFWRFLDEEYTEWPTA